MQLSVFPLAAMAGIVAQAAAIAVPPAPTSAVAPAAASDASSQLAAAASNGAARIADYMGIYNLILYEHHGFQGYDERYYFAYRGWDLAFGGCVPTAWGFGISSYKVHRMCCSFFSDQHCDERRLLFKATDRTDSALQGAHNDAIKAIMCVERC